MTFRISNVIKKLPEDPQPKKNEICKLHKLHCRSMPNHSSPQTICLNINNVYYILYGKLHEFYDQQKVYPKKLMDLFLWALNVT